MPLLTSADFFKIKFFRKILSGTLSECQKKVDTDQKRHFVRLDLGPNYLQSKVVVSMERKKLAVR